MKLICAILFCVLLSGSQSQAINVDDGLQAYNGDFPWVAYIEPLDIETFHAYPDCLGTLISSSWVFTTAYCNIIRSNDEFIPINGLFRVYLGAVNITESSIITGSTNFVTHPEFDVRRNLNNAALIQLPNEVIYSDQVQPIALPWNLPNVDLTGNAFVVGRRFINSGNLCFFFFIFKYKF